MKRLSIEQLLGINKFIVDEEAAHIVLNKEICAACAGKPCTAACPAGLYTLKDGKISFDYAGCLECGTCRVICPRAGAINWQYPRGGFGINYRYG
ncbi:MAG: ferredoxin family protein [Thermoanaerobacteraceae bacterium]|nr:ferredoxin family protein [Thermoanaerobacteraceae bacterium]